ncbi:MAG: FAD:protein FMN transferase [Thermomicrobiales bacterium]
MTAMQPLLSASFKAMGVDVTVAGVGISPEDVAKATHAAREAAEQWESMFSRFRPDSELSRLNGANGAATAVSSQFLAVVDLVVAGVRESDGRFNPAILPALERAGYDRSFETIGGSAEQERSPRPLPIDAGWVDEVVMDRSTSRISIPAGIRLDFGGIAKGAYVDAVTARLQQWPGGYVDAGGDLRVWGAAPDGATWRAGIQDPDDPHRNLTHIALGVPEMCAVATSGTYRRKWRQGAVDANHLIDPQSGRPLNERILSVTVVAGSVADAEIETKSLMVAGSRELPMILRRGGAAWVLTGSGTFEVLVNETHTARLSPSHNIRAAA